MTGEKVNFDEAASATAERKHERSSIAFPYLDLDSAVSVARAVYARAGHSACEIDELAAEMGQTVSGAFRLKTSSARMFGLLDKGDRSGLRLSQLGQEVVQPETEASARPQAFLTIPLYAEIFEKYKGHLLPPAKALEREMAALGVAPKQTHKARRIFERSAQQAGFFAQGEDRLVQPRFDRTPQTKPVTTPPAPPYGGGNGSDGNKPLEYQLIDLLGERMPNDVQKAVWTVIQYLKSSRLESERDDQNQTADDEPSAA